MAQGKSGQVSEASKWIAQLGSSSEAKRMEAETALLHLGEEGLEAILQYASGMANRFLLRLVILFNLAQGAVVGGGMWLCVGIGRLLHLNDDVILLLMIPALLVSALLNARYLGPVLLYPRRDRQFLHMVARIDDVRMIPSLLTPNTGSILTGLGIESALIRLLPRLRQEGEITLTARQRQILHARAMGRNGSIQLVLAALHALPILGDRSSIAFVKKLVSSEMKVAKNPAVREAAQLCLTALEAKFAQAQGNETLLRASYLPQNTSPQELLRPTIDTTSHNPEQMLRPARETHPGEAGDSAASKK